MASETKKGLTACALKNIAIFAMLFDHFVSVFLEGSFQGGSALRMIGRICAPVMCFFIAEGFHYTSGRRRYALRLFLFALLSHFPYVLYFGLNPLHATGVLWALLMGFLALCAAKSAVHPALRVLAVAACCVLAYPADWNGIAVLWIVGFGLFRGRFKLQMLCFGAVGLLLYILPALLQDGFSAAYTFGVFLSVPLLYLYNGKTGRRNALTKWGFYIFYPAHLLLLFGLRLWLKA